MAPNLLLLITTADTLAGIVDDDAAAARHGTLPKGRTDLALDPSQRRAMSILADCNKRRLESKDRMRDQASRSGGL
jgi:hypothetical protein